MILQAISALIGAFALGGAATAEPDGSARGASNVGAAGPSGSGSEMMLGSGAGMSGPGSVSYDTAPTGGDGSSSTAQRSKKGKRSTVTDGSPRAKAVAATGHNSSPGGLGSTDENGRGSGRSP